MLPVDRSHPHGRCGKEFFDPALPETKGEKLYAKRPVRGKAHSCGTFFSESTAPLAHGLEQGHSRRYRNIEAAEAARHRQVNQVIAEFPGEPAQPSPLSPQPQGHRTGEVQIVQAFIRLACRYHPTLPML